MFEFNSLAQIARDIEVLLRDVEVERRLGSPERADDNKSVLTEDEKDRKDEGAKNCTRNNT